MLDTVHSQTTPPPARIEYDLETIHRLVAADLSAMNAVIRERLYSDVALIQQVSEHIIESGGKRLRPLLVILAARACGYRGSAHHTLAAVVEFIHTATLLHDDVVDESSLRRGRPTANSLFGNAASVLVGDFLYSRAFQMMVEVQNMRVMEVLADTTNTIAEGEVLQLLNCHNPDTTEEDYLRVIRYKTAKLFEASGRLGGIVGGISVSQQEALARYGTQLGTAFQLIDDLLDYSGDLAQTGKNLGDDLTEGKPTLPLIYAMRNGTPQEAKVIRTAIEQGGLDEFEPVMAAIRHTGALEYTRKQAVMEAEKAKASLSGLSGSVYKDGLLQLPSFAVSRSY